MSIEWWRGAVLYQIYPRSFRDDNGDGIGDLPGVTRSLPYVADLGVDGIWLSPFFTSPMRDYGYDVADYRGVDPTFGTLSDFDELVERAHDLGLKVIIDQVYSHTSDQHPWFQESRIAAKGPKADWYVWADAAEDGTPPNNWLSVFGGPAWTWDARRRQYYLHNFLSEQPDLNFHNPEVREEILSVARFWLDRGVDGFRLDVANYYFHDQLLRDNPPAGTRGHARPALFQRHLYERSRPETLGFLTALRQILDGYDARMSVAEIDSTSPVARSIEYTEGQDRLHTAYSFSFLRAERLTPAIVREASLPWENSDAWPSWSFSNHDVKRAVTRWGAADPHPALANQLIALLCALRGTAFLYQGDELGLPQAVLRFEDLRDPEAIRFWPEDLGRDGARTPIPWEAGSAHAGFTRGVPWMPVDSKHGLMSVENQLDDPASTLTFTRNFLAFRKAHPALKEGSIDFLGTEDPVLLFMRKTKEEVLLCGFNLSGEAVSAEVEGRWRQLDSGLDATLEAGMVKLPPHGGFIAAAEAE